MLIANYTLMQFYLRNLGIIEHGHSALQMNGRDVFHTVGNKVVLQMSVQSSTLVCSTILLGRQVLQIHGASGETAVVLEQSGIEKNKLILRLTVAEIK